VPGVVDLEMTYESGKPEVSVNINRDKAADLNVNVAQVANAMRVLVGGDDQVTTYKEGDDRYDVLLRVSKEFRNSPQAIERLYVPSATLGNVPLSNVASLKVGSGPTSIDRYNRQRRVLVMANVNKGLALGDLIAIVQKEIDQMNLPAEYRHGAVGRSKELGRAVTNFLMAFLLSVVFMYMILAANYESFIDPITILLSLPLSVPFALLSLFLARENFSIVYTSLGILVLFGIVKKNSILQIDHIKGLRRGGMSRREAVFQGCDDRLRPILMTTAALVAGMLPLAFGTGAGAGTRRTVAIVVIGGQSLALVLTLLVTPVAYTFFDDVAHWSGWRRMFGIFRRNASTAAVVLLAVLLSVAPLAAQDATQAAYDKVLKAPRVGVSALVHELSLEQAIALALANNLEIELERTNVTTARSALKGAKGMFDSVILYQPGLQSNNTPAASSLAAANGKVSEHYFTNNLSVRQKTPWQGVALNVAFENTRQSTNNPFVSLNPNFTSRLTVGFSAPLWRYRDTDAERAQLKIRRKMQTQSETDFETRATDVLTRTQSAYWDLVAAIEDAVVASEGVRLAQELFDLNQRQIAAGTLAPIEKAASEAELQRRVDSYVGTIANLTLAENNLKLMLTQNRQDPLWNERVRPTDVRTMDLPPESVEQATTVALQKRPEIRSLDLRSEQNDEQKKLAASATKPQVNLTANYINSGLAGTQPATTGGFAAALGPAFSRIDQLSILAGLPPLPTTNLGGSGVPANFVGGYGQSLSNLFGGSFQSVQAGLNIEWNPRNRAAKAQLEQAAVAERRLKLGRAQLEQGIGAEVRGALQALESARQRITAARASETAAQEKLSSEIRLFQTGESTNFLVLTRQNELLDSRRRVTAAVLQLNKTVARLHQVLGTTLETHKVEIQ